MGEFLSFRRMVTPVLIQIVFWLGIIGIVIAGILMIASAYESDPYIGQSEWDWGMVVSGIMVIFFSSFLLRLMCELWILRFLQHEVIVDIRNMIRRELKIDQFNEEEIMVVGSNDSEDITDDILTPKDIKCPICYSKTVIRTSKQGPNAGREFHVCTLYPSCKGKIEVD